RASTMARYTSASGWSSSGARAPYHTCSRPRAMRRGSGIELHLIKLAVESAARQQLVMGARLGDAPLIQHHDAGRLLDGAQAVGDRQRGAAGGQSRQRLLHMALGVRIQ